MRREVIGTAFDPIRCQADNFCELTHLGTVKYIVWGGSEMEFLASSLLELITQTSTNLPPDVRAAMSIAAKDETPDTQSSQALDIILLNIDIALAESGPPCQDTRM